MICYFEVGITYFSLEWGISHDSLKYKYNLANIFQGKRAKVVNNDPFSFQCSNQLGNKYKVATKTE